MLKTLPPQSRLQFMPKPSQTRAACVTVQAAWAETEERSRLGVQLSDNGQAPGRRPPVVTIGAVGDYGDR